MTDRAERLARKGVPPKSSVKINICSELAGCQAQTPTAYPTMCRRNNLPSGQGWEGILANGARRKSQVTLILSCPEPHKVLRRRTTNYATGVFARATAAWRGGGNEPLQWVEGLRQRLDLYSQL